MVEDEEDLPSVATSVAEEDGGEETTTEEGSEEVEAEETLVVVEEGSTTEVDTEAEEETTRTSTEDLLLLRTRIEEGWEEEVTEEEEEGIEVDLLDEVDLLLSRGGTTAVVVEGTIRDEEGTITGMEELLEEEGGEGTRVVREVGTVEIEGEGTSRSTGGMDRVSDSFSQFR